MSRAAARALASPTRLIAFALIAGLVLGAFAAGMSDGWREPTIRIASTVGGLWLDALRMTVIPLLFALLFKGVVGSSRALGGGKLAARTIVWFLVLYVVSALFGALFTPVLLSLMPLPPEALEALRSALGSVDSAALSKSVIATDDVLRSLIPTNVFKAAAEGSMLQLIVFALVFALAASRLDPKLADPLLKFFDAVGQAMLLIVQWILVVAPVGVFALAYTLAAGTGAGVFGAVFHYILIYCLVGVGVLVMAYLVAIFAARFSPATFAKTMLPVQSFALSTQSSTASLPLMVVTSAGLGVRETTRDIVLPMAVSLFRMTGPAMNIAVCMYIAHWLGLDIGVGDIAAGVLVAVFASLAAPGLPGQISFITSIGPIAIAMGVPIAPLGVFIALEPVPDMLRTVGNVTMDVAVAGAVDRSAEDGKAAD